MKKVLGIVVAAVLVFSLPAAAQRGPGGNHKSHTPEQVAQRQTEMLSGKLSLTSQQQKEIYKLNLKKAQSAQDKGKAYKKEGEKRYKAAVSEREKYDKKMKKILDNEQYDKWQADSRRHAARGRGKLHSHPRHGEARGGHGDPEKDRRGHDSSAPMPR